MGNFANTLFSVLLGWVQSATAWLWSLITSDGAGGLMGWVLDNWLLLAVALCLLGLIVDGIVYLLRWQPYRVWRSFLGRSGEETLPETPPAVEEEPLQWVYANGEIAPDPVEQEALYASQPQCAPQERQPRVIPARRRTQPETAQGSGPSGYYQPCYPPQWRGKHERQTDGGTTE